MAWRVGGNIGGTFTDVALVDDGGRCRSQLASDGLVVNRPQRGHFVQAYDARTVDDLYGLCAMLERHAVELAPLPSR